MQCVYILCIVCWSIVYTLQNMYGIYKMSHNSDHHPPLGQDINRGNSLSDSDNNGLFKAFNYSIHYI